MSAIEAPPARKAPAIAEAITRRRGDLTACVAELDRRRHELTDVRLQIRRHARGVTLTVLAMSAAAAGSVAYGMWRARRRNTLIARGSRLRDALGRMLDRPERVAAEPTITQRILSSAGSAAAAFLVKAALNRVSRPRRSDPRTLERHHFGSRRESP
jgi:hypothetical protein